MYYYNSYINSHYFIFNISILYKSIYYYLLFSNYIKLLIQVEIINSII